jgi:methanogenic corrinoid protein MtbC1
MNAKDTVLESIAGAVREGSEKNAVDLCEKALGDGVPPREIIREGLCRGMHVVGELYERNEYFLPELLLASEAMHAGIHVLMPSLKAGSGEERETVVLGVVEGDVHEIGKNLVGVMLEADGYRVIDLGFDVPPQKFIDEIEAHEAQVLALSTMMTTTLPSMRATVDLAGGLERRPIVIVGGAPLSEAVAVDMGAMGYEDNAAKVPALIRSLLAENTLSGQAGV